MGTISAFNVDDSLNQPLADLYGIVMGTSHEEPMMRSIPVEWGLFGNGAWDYTTNSDFIYNFWINGTERAKPYESLYTIGMRGEVPMIIIEVEGSQNNTQAMVIVGHSPLIVVFVENRLQTVMRSASFGIHQCRSS